MAGGPDDAIELGDEHRRYISDLFARLDTLSAYELLGVRADADRKEVKRAYFELVRTMHPDRWFGKNLGPYRSKLETIFQRLTMAYETLSDPTRRTEHDARVVPRAGARSPRVVAPEAAAARQAAMDALKRRFEESKVKANALAAVAVRARAAGDLVGAVEAYRKARELAPGDAALAAAQAEVEREAAARLVESHRAKASLDERLGRWDDAVESWRRVTEARPEDEEAQVRLRAALRRSAETKR